jgi:hypothetical protein
MRRCQSVKVAQRSADLFCVRPRYDQTVDVVKHAHELAMLVVDPGMPVSKSELHSR